MAVSFIFDQAALPGRAFPNRWGSSEHVRNWQKRLEKFQRSHGFPVKTTGKNNWQTRKNVESWGFLRVAEPPILKWSLFKKYRIKCESGLVFTFERTKNLRSEDVCDSEPCDVSCRLAWFGARRSDCGLLIPDSRWIWRTLAAPRYDTMADTSGKESSTLSAKRFCCLLAYPKWLCWAMIKKSYHFKRFS